MRNNKKSFSLVELLVVTAMLGVISLAIYSTFNNGLKVWYRINHRLADEDVNIFFDRFGRDLNNCFKSVNFSFTGNATSLNLPTLVNSRQLGVNSLGEVTYLCNPQSGMLYRQQKDFSQIYNRQEDQPQVLLKNVKFFRIQYYYWDSRQEKYLWKEEWLDAGLPVAVRVSLSLDDSSESDEIIRTFNIPAAG